MSSIRLSGTSSGYYDLTVPAAAGTNSIDLSNLPVKDSSGNLAITGQLGINTTGTGVSGQFGTGITVRRAVPEVHLQRDDGAGNGGVLMDNASSTRRMYVGTYDANSETHIGTNGTQRVIVNASGHVAMPNQPGFTVYTNSSTATGNIIQFGGTSFNTGNHFNTSTGIFTAPITGHYWFYWHLLSDRTTTAGEGYLDIFKNSNYHYRNFEYKEAGGNYHVEYKGGTIMHLAANDTMYLYFQASANGGNIISNFHHCKFSGYLLG